MDFNQLLILQLIAHFLTDFTFQSNQWAKSKNKKGFRSKYLKWHIIVVFALSYFFSFQLQFGIAAAIIAITHFLIDGCRPILNRNNFIGPYSFFIDQILHISIIIAVVFLFPKIVPSIVTEFHWINYKYLAIGLSVLLCTKPANIFIKETLRSFDIQFPRMGKENQLPNAGSLIGIVERLLVITFVFMHQYEAIGFLIAAKSILRFKDDSGVQSEYVLIGTMLSFAFAIFLGLFIAQLWM